MKKIFLILAAAAALVACDPVEEDFSNAGHISLDELLAKTSVTTDKDDSGKNGNQIYCTTSAPVNAKWEVGGKELVGNYAYKKVKLGDYTVTMTALCADGEVLTAEFPVKVETITNQLERYYIYGHPEADNPNHHLIGFEGDPFSPAAWDAAEMRFSDNEGKHLPYLSDDVYWGFKTLVFDITDATPDCAGRIMNGWWAARYDGDKDVQFTNGQWELQLTETIAKDCARGNGGAGKDLDIMVTSGSCTVNAVYYEE